MQKTLRNMRKMFLIRRKFQPTAQNFKLNCIMKLTAQMNLTALKDFCSDVIGGKNNIFVPKNGDVTTERSIY